MGAGAGTGRERRMAAGAGTEGGTGTGAPIKTARHIFFQHNNVLFVLVRLHFCMSTCVCFRNSTRMMECSRSNAMHALNQVGQDQQSYIVGNYFVEIHICLIMKTIVGIILYCVVLKVTWCNVVWYDVMWSCLLWPYETVKVTNQ